MEAFPVQVKEMDLPFLPFHGFKEAIGKTIPTVISPENRLGGGHYISIEGEEQVSAHAVKVMKIKKSPARGGRLYSKQLVSV